MSNMTVKRDDSELVPGAVYLVHYKGKSQATFWNENSLQQEIAFDMEHGDVLFVVDVKDLDVARYLIDVLFKEKLYRNIVCSRVGWRVLMHRVEV